MCIHKLIYTKIILHIHIPSADEESFLGFFKESSLPHPFSSGWVGELPCAKQQGTQQQRSNKNRNSASIHASSPKYKSAVISASQFGADAGATAPEPILLEDVIECQHESPLLFSSNSHRDLSYSKEYSDDDFSADAWASDDPLAIIEHHQTRLNGPSSTEHTDASAAGHATAEESLENAAASLQGSKHKTLQESIADLASARNEWQYIMQHPELTRCLLNARVDEVGTGSRQFTAKQLKYGDGVVYLSLRILFFKSCK